MEIKKQKKKPISYYSNKADKLLQELGRLKFNSCEICGKELSCLHHYYPKSSAGNLRYNWNNLIPICVGCHMAHHLRFSPEIHDKVKEIRGAKWLKELQQAKLIPNYQCNTKSYYEMMAEELKKQIQEYETTNKN